MQVNILRLNPRNMTSQIKGPGYSSWPLLNLRRPTDSNLELLAIWMDPEIDDRIEASLGILRVAVCVARIPRRCNRRAVGPSKHCRAQRRRNEKTRVVRK